MTHSPKFTRNLISAFLCVLLAAPAHAGTPREELRFALILSGHGIHMPLQSPASLNEYAAEPWPEWEVLLGHLTPHGAAAIREMGAFIRLDFARQSLFTASGCPSPAEIYLHADTDERNIASTAAHLRALPLAVMCSPSDCSIAAKAY
ncbi:hypothetical protein FTO74_06690 [Granulicella sp. WH15]|nr:hypothetical protein FTO74_06690 [Granulicella sp. WH15]